jgi:hypothetical protein
MGKYTEKDAATDIDTSSSKTGEAHHDAREHARQEGEIPDREGKGGNPFPFSYPGLGLPPGAGSGGSTGFISFTRRACFSVDHETGTFRRRLPNATRLCGAPQPLIADAASHPVDS